MPLKSISHETDAFKLNCKPTRQQDKGRTAKAQHNTLHFFKTHAESMHVIYACSIAKDFLPPFFSGQ
ncbi:hypothetical protein E2C01_021608 [Portunus trituberculatus]|uniref:Uncharacterized protein n=1 Tax=Portunus trituberculatus TaxID=210409 RepID=A0A5B7E6J9_PORTR|nr:hypothetical protein [Portunus trituberculatus]